MIIIVSGFAGSGKSTLADRLAKEFNLQVVHASNILQQLRKMKIEEIDVKHTSASSGWWESREAEKYLHEREKDGSMDLALDKKLFEIIEKGNVVVDSKTMGNLSKKGFKIWLDCSAETRAGRIAERDGLDAGAVLKRINERDATDRKIYRKLYGFDLGSDLKGFDLVIHSDNMTAEQVFGIAREKIKGASKG